MTDARSSLPKLETTSGIRIEPLYDPQGARLRS